MRRFLALSVLALGMALTVMAEDYSGYIVDASCAAKQGVKAASDGHAACAVRCINGGSPAVLVTAEGKVYKISDQDKVKEHAGHKVTITGKADGDTLSVDSIKM